MQRKAVLLITTLICRKSLDSFYTSDDVREFTSLGYTYPDFENRLEEVGHQKQSDPESYISERWWVFSYWEGNACVCSDSLAIVSDLLIHASACFGGQVCVLCLHSGLCFEGLWDTKEQSSGELSSSKRVQVHENTIKVWLTNLNNDKLHTHHDSHQTQCSGLVRPQSMILGDQ